MSVNLKIPIALLGYKLSPTTLIVFGELYGLYYKRSSCFITDKTLTNRLNRSTASIQRSMHELKNHGLIHSQQKPNHRGRNITVLFPESKKFLLIPVQVARDKRLKSSSILLFGLLYSHKKKIEKIHIDNHSEDEPAYIQATKTELAKELGKTPEFIRQHLIDLWDKGYLGFKSYSGKGLIIELDEDADAYMPEKKKHQKNTKTIYFDFRSSFKVASHYLTKWRQGTNRMSSLIQNIKSVSNPKNDKKVENITYAWSKVPTERATTYQQNEQPPTNRMSSHLPTERATNRYLIDKSNREDSFHSSSSNRDQSEIESVLKGKPLTKPFYYDSIPDEDDIPPKPQNIVNDFEISELNKIDTAKSRKNKKLGEDAENNWITELLKPKKIKSPVYKGYNLDYFINQIKKILHKATNKNYIIAQPAKQAIKQRLDEGFTLDDFKQAIYNLTHQGKSISIRQLATHLKEYLNPTTVNSQRRNKSFHLRDASY